MLKHLGRPSPATVIACLALFFAVAGGSAMALQGKNTVDSGDIKKGQVKTSDIANNAVTTKKIKANNVRSGDIANGQVRTADIARAEALHVVGPGQLGTGGQNDCIWSTSDPAFPIPPFHFGSPGYYKDALGYVHLTGVLFPVDGPGGDANCGGSGAEVSEDAIAFILPPGYRPANDVLSSGGGGGAVVIGTTPLVSPSYSFPAGAVASPSTATPMLLNGINFEPAGLAGGIPRRGADAPVAGDGDMQDFANLFG